MILFFLTSLIIANSKVKAGIPVGLDSYKPVKSVVLSGGVSDSKDLPTGFYGTWAVKSLTLETNNLDYEGAKGMNIWSLSRNGNVITLSNPQSGAIASITVNEVHGNKVKFTREKMTESYIESETPELLLEGMSFSGTDTLIIKHLRRGEIYKTDVVKYKVDGLKLSGPTLKDLFAK